MLGVSTPARAGSNHEVDGSRSRLPREKDATRDNVWNWDLTDAKAPGGIRPSRADVIARILPFGVYIMLTALEKGPSVIEPLLPLSTVWTGIDNLWLYPLKIGIVAVLVVWYWKDYDELRGRGVGGGRVLAFAVGTGILVYVAWIQMTWPWATQGQPGGYDPFRAGLTAGVGLAVLRTLGSVVVVPVMEELFWRSFLVRYLVKADFRTVSLGVFTPFSFVATVILFGLEHHLWLAGMVAGAAFNLVLLRTRRLWPCVLAHGISNLALATHVLLRSEWHWW